MKTSHIQTPQKNFCFRPWIFIRSFILETCISRLQESILLRGASSQVTAKEEGLQRDLKFERVVITKERWKQYIQSVSI